MRSLKAALVAAMITTLMLSSCGAPHHAAATPSSSSPTSEATRPAPSSTAPRQTTTTGTTPSPKSTSTISGTTTAATTTTTSAPTGPSACSSRQLTVSLRLQQGAGGSGLYAFVVVNHGSPCQLGGYFGVSVYNRVGDVIGASDQRFSHPRTLLLSSDHEASFLVELGEVPTGHATTCPHIGAFHLIPPNDTTFDQVSLPANPPRGDCTKGVAVYPDRSGTAGLHPF